MSRATEEEGRVQRCGRVHVQMCVQHGGRSASGPGHLPHRASPGRHRPPETSPDSRGADGHPSTRGISKELGGRVLKPPYLTQILQKNHSGWEACWLCPSEHKETAGAAQRGLGEREASCGQWSAPGGGTGSPEVSQQRASGPGRAGHRAPCSEGSGRAEKATLRRPPWTSRPVPLPVRPPGG